MTDLERFFRRLIQALSAGDPARLREPIAIQDIRGSILPYRTNRRALSIDSSEDYELVLMRLCAGQGGFAQTNPEEARQRFEREVTSPNPDLTTIRQFRDATVILSPHRVAWAMATMASINAEAPPPNAEPEVPREVEAEHPPAAPAETSAARPEADAEIATTLPWPAPSAPVATPVHAALPESAPPATPAQCIACDQLLPANQSVKFCPYCGTSQLPAHCSACNTELQRGWKFCPSCGQAA